MIHQTNLAFSESLVTRTKTSLIVLHHSEVTSPHTVYDVHKWHQKKGWAGIGYHYFISKDGNIYEGRPLDTVGAHTYGYNKESIGVCFEGNFNKEKVSDLQIDASIMLLAILSLAHNNIPIKCHRELVPTKMCPGKLFPIDHILENVRICKKYLVSLFGVGNSKYQDILSLLDIIAARQT